MIDWLNSTPGQVLLGSTGVLLPLLVFLYLAVRMK